MTWMYHLFPNWINQENCCNCDCDCDCDLDFDFDNHKPSAVALPWQTIQEAFHQLGQRVTTALRTQIGDDGCFRAQQDECHHFLNVVQMVQTVQCFSKFDWYLPG
jgi:hypothetical protein